MDTVLQTVNENAIREILADMDPDFFTVKNADNAIYKDGEVILVVYASLTSSHIKELARAFEKFYLSSPLISRGISGTDRPCACFIVGKLRGDWPQ